MSKNSKSLFKHQEFIAEHSLAEELPYWDFLEDDSLVLSDGTLVSGFKLKGVSVETWDVERINGFTHQLRGFLNSLPDGADLQVVVENNADFSDKIDAHEKLKGDDPTIGWVASARIAALRARRDANILHRQNLFLFVCHRITTSQNKFASFFSKPKKFVSLKREDHEKRRAELSQVTESLKNHLDSMGIGVTVVTSDQIRDIIYRVLNPTRSMQVGSPKPSNAHKDQEFTKEEISLLPQLSEPSPREQLVFSDLIQGVDSFYLDGFYHRIITLKTLPEFTHAAMVSKLFSLPFHYLASVQIVVPEQSKELSSLRAKRRMAHSMSLSHGGRATDLESEAKLQSTEGLLREIINTGQKIFYFQLAISLKADSKDELDLQTKQTLSKFREMSGSEGLSETVAGFKVFKTMLPAGNTTVVRSKRIKTDNLADFLPLYQNWEGSGKPVCLFQDRMSGLISYDPFDPNLLPNFNSLLTGSSGSGKSFLNNCVLLQSLTQKPMVFVIEVGDSKGKICEFVGGRRIEMVASPDGSYRHAINPFSLPIGATEPSPRKIKFLISLLETILADEEGDKLTKLDKSLLEEAIIETYKQYLPKKVPKLSDLVQTLEKDSALKNFAKMLYPWTGNRPYGRLLDSDNALNLDSEMVVFDLKGVDPDLRAPMILIITDFILGKMEASKGRRGQIYLDEVWDLLKSHGAIQFMEFCVRTLRKEGWGITFITQGLEEVVASPIGSAILNNTATKFILMQRGDLEPTRKILKLNDQELTLIRSLRQQKGEYSEAFLISNDERGVIRVVPTPIEYWLSTSDPSDNQLLSSVKEFFPKKTFSEIIFYLATEFPKGSQGQTTLNPENEKGRVA